MSQEKLNQNVGKGDMTALAAALLIAEESKNPDESKDFLYDRITLILDPLKAYAEKLEEENEDFILSALLDRAYDKIKVLIDALEDQVGDIKVVFKYHSKLYRDFSKKDILRFEVSEKTQDEGQGVDNE